MRCVSFIFVLGLLLSSLAAAAPIPVINTSETWKYFIGTQEASLPTNAWRTTGYNDSGWLSGPAPIGYSTADPKTGYEATIATPIAALPIGQTVYFRKAFVLTNLNNLTS